MRASYDLTCQSLPNLPETRHSSFVLTRDQPKVTVLDFPSLCLRGFLSSSSSNTQALRECQLALTL